MRGEHDGGDDRHSSWRLSLYPVRVPVFRRRCGAGRLPDRAGGVREPLPLAAGFAWIERYLGEQGVPLAAFCACELRSPAQFTDTGLYRIQPPLHRHATALGRDDRTRTTTRWRAATSSHRSTSRPNRASTRSASRVLPPARQGRSSSPAAARRATDPRRIASARCVTARPAPTRCVRRRCSCWGGWRSGWPSLGKTWADTTATQVYTVYDVHTSLADEIVRRGAARHGLVWHFARPPVEGLEYEMDCRSVPVEHIVTV